LEVTVLDTLTAPTSLAGGIGDPTAYSVVVDALLAAPDGATVSRSGTPYGGNGIVVALPEHARIVDNPTPELVWQWVRDVAHHVTVPTPRPRFFGVWTSGHVAYLDVVEVFPADERDAAVAAGRARNQIAIWDAGRQVEIPTDGTGEL